ncbi:beta-N-acetylhexosaminidase [Paractinoplanes lichenicola]|uniref:beta-N-acetylhexosaminidase n=1 Tax=Paractinoplanes lichenicola TaxID=2802976 RepID=A0ABS1VM00_9ACTN|nr:beta-N-acetylhexosaminidase [Actinoplanes lichenicola]MBL7255752.1 beta-N-acetylhexosaminidase [Actinoplanes lichenicola]
MRTRLAVFLAGVLPLTVVAAPAQAAPPTVALGSVIPAPVDVRPSGGGFRITARTVIEAPAAARGVAEQLGEALRLRVVGHAPPRTGKIALELGKVNGKPESYRLTVDKRGVTLRSATTAGLFNGVQTLQQLVPVSGPRTIAGGEIIDYPRFGYRGTMLDIARHFHTPGEIKRHIDEISKFKVNYLHLHLSDDQGWRIQIDSRPRLTTVGGAAGTGVDGVGGGFLTKADYRDLVRYAASRHVTIVPEIDMPGHVNAAQVAYPELTCDGVAPPPRTDTAVGYSSLCIGSETTYRFVEDVVRELAEMTPGPFIHIGGDEAHATTQADYLTFQKRVLPLVTKYGKTAYGWNEIAAAPEANVAVAQFWSSATQNPAVAAAVANGTKVIMSPANLAYIDQKYDPTTRLGLSWAGYIEVRKAYDWDPGTHVTGVPESAVLGVEAPLWSETLRSLDDIEYMAWPRLAGIAELGWSPARDWESFRTRLGAYGPRWAARGVDFYRSPQIDWAS